MIKNTTTTILFTTVLFSLPLVVLAENATTSGVRGKLFNRIEEVKPKINLRLASTTTKIEDARAKLENRLASTTKRVEERKGKLDEKRKENVRRLGTFMTERFGAAVDRIEKLIERLEERLATWKSEGKNINTTEAERNLGEAKTTLGVAKTSLDDLKAKIEELVGAENPGTLVPEIRTLSQKTASNIKKSHESLMTAIRSLKNATSTNQN